MFGPELIEFSEDGTGVAASAWRYFPSGTCSSLEPKVQFDATFGCGQYGVKTYEYL